MAVFTLVLVPVATQSFAEGSFDGHSSIDPPLSEVVSGQSTTMNIKFMYTSGPYTLNNFIPIIEVNPSSAGKFVKVEVDPLEITQGQIKRIPVTLTVDPHIEHEKIFLSISYAGNHFMSGELQKSLWNDQIELDVKDILVPEPGQDRPISENCGPETTLQNGMCVVDKTKENHMDSDRWGDSAYVKSPLKQFKSGISIDEIQCKDGLVNIIKISNGLPACVKPDTKEKLMQIGWATEPMFYGLTKPQITDIQHAKIGCKKTGNQTYCDEMIKEKTEFYLKQNKPDAKPEPSPEPEPMSESEILQKQKQQQAKIHTQEVIMTDYRDPQYHIKTINDYRNEFEDGYFLEQFIVFTNKQDYEKDDIINFIFVEWGYQPQKCTFPKIEVYLRSYADYDKIEKIGEWQKPDGDCLYISSDSDGYLIMNLHPIPGIFEPYQICTIPGEYRILAKNLEDESQVEWGYFTCQKDRLVGEPQPWMELPE